MQVSQNDAAAAANAPTEVMPHNHSPRRATARSRSQVEVLLGIGEGGAGLAVQVRLKVPLDGQKLRGAPRMYGMGKKGITEFMPTKSKSCLLRFNSNPFKPAW